MKFRDVLNEKNLRSEWDKEYLDLLKRAYSLSWDQVASTKQSAINGIEGRFKNGTGASFDYHRPDSKWGPHWNFLGLIIEENGKLKEMFNKSGEEILNIKIGQSVPNDLQKKNIKEFSDAIKFAEKYGKK